MENCIRQLRKERGLTLAGLAARCAPPTTAQTIGRLETGMRTLSLDWLDRIAAALDVPPDRLIMQESADAPHLVARLGVRGAQALEKPSGVSLPRFGPHVRLVAVIDTVGEFRAGDLLWFETIAPERLAEAVNRPVLMPGRAGAFHIGRLASVTAEDATLLPLQPDGAVERIAGFAWAAQLRKLIRNYG